MKKKRRDRNITGIVVGIAAVGVGYWIGWGNNGGHYLSIAGGLVVIIAVLHWTWPFKKTS